MLLNLVYSSPIRTQYKIAIHLITLLLPRKLEIQNATWEQVDFKNKTFTITDSKMGTDLLIKLSTQAVQLFKIQKTLAGNSSYIFPGRNLTDKPMSHNTLNYVLRPILKNQIEDFVVHDLRRTGATNLGELGYPMEVIEAALNHTKTGILKVYHRTQYIEQRDKMLADWANKIDALIRPELLPYDKYFPI
ncbi:MAG: site-specific integrase [Burkholderiales bacterium]|nr:site-specific integrase [Burkholderiales bacterium]